MALNIVILFYSRMLPLGALKFIDFNIYIFCIECNCICRTGLTFGEILPENFKSYDKMRPPKKDGQATTVFFHVTVMGLDSIDETSMVND